MKKLVVCWEEGGGVETKVTFFLKIVGLTSTSFWGKGKSIWSLETLLKEKSLLYNMTEQYRKVKILSNYLKIR